MNPDETKMCGEDCIFYYSVGGNIINGCFEKEKGFCCKEEIVTHCDFDTCQQMKHIAGKPNDR